jgi:hypothetical protein
MEPYRLICASVLRSGVGDSAIVRHSRMLLAGIQANFGLDPRLKHSGVTIWGKVIQGPQVPRRLAARLFITAD